MEKTMIIQGVSEMEENSSQCFQIYQRKYLHLKPTKIELPMNTQKTKQNYW